MNVPILIHKDRGVGSSSNLGINAIGNEVASCLCARDYKGISREGANAVLVIEDSMKNNIKNFRLFDAYNKREIANNCIGTLLAHSNVSTTRAGTFMIGLCEEDGRGTLGKNEVNDLDAQNNNLRIRKLTPKECWRLQGFGFPLVDENGSYIRDEDGAVVFDDSLFEKAVAAGVSNTQLYKQAGNAVTVNAAFAIGKKLKEVEDETSR